MTDPNDLLPKFLEMYPIFESTDDGYYLKDKIAYDEKLQFRWISSILMQVCSVDFGTNDNKTLYATLYINKGGGDMIIFNDTRVPDKTISEYNLLGIRVFRINGARLQEPYDMAKIHRRYTISKILEDE